MFPLLLPSLTKATFQRIIYQLWSEWSDGETKFCIFSLELEAIFKMLFFINIDHSSNKFPPIPGYKSATIWCLLDNDESGHVNVCEHRAPRLPLLPSFKTCSPPRSPKIFSFLSPNFLKILYSGIFFFKFYRQWFSTLAIFFISSNDLLSWRSIYEDGTCEAATTCVCI